MLILKLALSRTYVTYRERERTWNNAYVVGWGRGFLLAFGEGGDFDAFMFIET